MITRNKFRAWDIVLNKFETEYVVVKPNGEVCVLGMSDNACIPSHGDRFIIQWFTGLKDTNERDVYEGDIVEVEFQRCGKQVCHIEKEPMGFKFMLLPSDDVPSIPMSIDDRVKSLKVIGDIFENPVILVDNATAADYIIDYKYE